MIHVIALSACTYSSARSNPGTEWPQSAIIRVNTARLSAQTPVNHVSPDQIRQNYGPCSGEITREENPGSMASLPLRQDVPWRSGKGSNSGWYLTGVPGSNIIWSGTFRRLCAGLLWGACTPLYVVVRRVYVHMYVCRVHVWVLIDLPYPWVSWRWP